MIAGTDAHAKNCSLLLGNGGRVRIAPLYDLASVLPYHDARRIKLAMKVGGRYGLREIGRAQWEQHARELGPPIVDRLAPLLTERAVEVVRTL